MKGVQRMSALIKDRLMLLVLAILIIAMLILSVKSGVLIWNTGYSHNFWELTIYGVTNIGLYYSYQYLLKRWGY
jgi:hypothetical protein